MIALLFRALIPSQIPRIVLKTHPHAKAAKVYGKVLCILERPESHMFIGTLSVDVPGGKLPSKFSVGLGPVDSSVNIIWFRPSDKRVPFVMIPVENAPHEFLKFPKDNESMLFKASIKRWPIHSQYPFGVVHGKVGEVGSISIETEALLIENGITWSDFSEDVLQCLPPTTAKDLDDALSIVPLEDGLVEVGVHIADVSYFVKPGTALDTEARRRATTVYLTQKSIPMLPRLLCEELCSLNPGVDRLAFSVTWKMDPKSAEIVGKPWFGRSIIRSCAKLSYDHAQRLIEGKDWSGLPDVQLHGQ
ncbi:hypothetical protein HK405_000588, partial [Cladochytrium tenue]